MEQDSAWRLPSRPWMLTAGGSGSKAKLEKARLFTWCCQRGTARRSRNHKRSGIGVSARLQRILGLFHRNRSRSLAIARGTWNSDPERCCAARRLTACNRRNDTDFVAQSDWGLGFFQKAYIFVIQEYVNKPANMIMVVADALFQTGIGPIETSDHFADRCTIGF